MDFISTKGGWYCRNTIAYFDNPNDYENPDDAHGWMDAITENELNVVEYAVLDEIDQKEIDPFDGLDQKGVVDKFGTARPNLGCVGK